MTKTNLDAIQDHFAAGETLSREEAGLLLAVIHTAVTRGGRLADAMVACERLTAPAPAPQPDICHWHETPTGVWQTTCYARHDGPLSDGAVQDGFCVYCSRDVKVHPLQQAPQPEPKEEAEGLCALLNDLERRAEGKL